MKFQFRFDWLKSIILKTLSTKIFKKLRVIHLIISLIALMVIFLGIQGYLGITNVDAIRVNEKSFSTSQQNLKDIYAFHNNLLFIKENYLKRMAALSDSSALDYPFKSIEDNLKKIAQISQNTYANSTIKELGMPEPSIDLIATVKDLKKLAYAANTKQDFLDCEAKLFKALKDLDNIESQVMQSSENTSVYSKNVSAKQTQTVMILLTISICIAILIGALINFSISWPLREIIKSARAMAAGDFTRNVQSFGCRESDEVVKELNASRNSLRLLIGKINKESETIARASEELKTASKESGQSAEQVARAMEELARAASSQADQMTQTAQTVNSLGAMVRRVSKDTINIAGISESVAESAKNGQKVTDDVAQEINQIYLSTMEIGEVIRDLRKATEEIGEITVEIREITDETALLSLNASIEAARAGEHGRGFSVVANATGKLAERCRVAAQTIADRTVHMSDRTEHAVQLMEQGVARVEEGKNLAGQATVTFEGIFNELKAVLAQINEVAESAKKMSKHNEEVISAVANIAAISEESMAGTEEVSATAEEQTAAAQEVTSQSESLLKISNEIKQATAVFKI